MSTRGELQPSAERGLSCKLECLGPSAGRILIRCMSLYKSLISCFVSFGKRKWESATFTWPALALADCMDVDCVLAAFKDAWVEVCSLSHRLNTRPKRLNWEDCFLPSAISLYLVPSWLLSALVSHVVQLEGDATVNRLTDMRLQAEHRTRGLLSPLVQ